MTLVKLAMQHLYAVPDLGMRVADLPDMSATQIGSVHQSTSPPFLLRLGTGLPASIQLCRDQYGSTQVQVK